MTKREVLLAICETPGWQPPEDASSTGHWVHELLGEGWIVPRLDGYEATPQALDEYPTFPTQADIYDPGAASEEKQLPARELPQAPDGTILIDRVTALIVAMLAELPFITVAKLTAENPPELTVDMRTWKLAHEMAEGMR